MVLGITFGVVLGLICGIVLGYFSYFPTLIRRYHPMFKVVDKIQEQRHGTLYRFRKKHAQRFMLLWVGICCTCWIVSVFFKESNEILFSGIWLSVSANIAGWTITRFVCEWLDKKVFYQIANEEQTKSLA